MRIYRVFFPAVLFFFVCLSFELFAQVGINGSSSRVSGSAMLDINSSDKGLLIPRITSENRDLIPSPATGLLIYNTTTSHFNYYNGSFWYQIESSFVSATTGTLSPGGGVSVSGSVNKLPDNSAMLDVSDPIRGFLPARTTTGSIISPDNGLIIYDLTDNLLKYYFDNKWYPVCAVSTGVHATTGIQTAVGVSINSTGVGPHHSSILDVSSSDKGLLIPRLTTIQRDAILPVPGLTIFNISSKTIEYFNGTEWLMMDVIVQADVTITTSAMTVCAGTAVTFTATPVNGGDLPAYRWKVNGSEAPGATNVTFTYEPGHGDAVSCEMTSSSICAIGNPANSNIITMTVNPLLPVTISISGSANPVCEGIPVTFTANPVNGGTTPVFQWKVNGTDAGTNDASYTYTPVSGDQVSCLLTSNATCATGSPFLSNIVTMAVDPVPAITAMTSATCGGTGFTVTPVNITNGTVPAGTTYSWSAPSVTGGLAGGAAASGQSAISGTLVNPTNTPQTATYTVTPLSGSCTGSTFTVTVTVQPTPALTAMTASACTGAGFTATPVNGTNGIVPSGTTYSWSAPAVTGGITGGAPGSGQSNISGTLFNPTNTNQTATYTVTPLSGSCTGNAFTVTVTVRPAPAITAMTATTCGGTAFSATPVNATNGIVPAGTTYSWPAPAVTGGLTGGIPRTGQSNITGTLINPTNVNQTATYTVTPLSGSCTGNTFTVTVTVRPTPAITAMTATTCGGTGFSATPANGTNGIVPSGTTYSWSAPAVTGGLTGGASGTGQSNISGTLVNPTNVNQTATYTVTPLSGSCTGLPFTVTVTVRPTPAITAMIASACTGTGFTATPVNGTNGIVPTGTTYSWSAPSVTGGLTGGIPGSGQSNITGTLVNPTNINQTATYTVTPLSGSCTGSTFTVTVTVRPAPAITAMTATTCGGTGFTATPVNATNGIVPAGTTYSWPAPAVTGGLTGGAAGSGQSTVSGTLSNPTSIPQTATYTVTPLSGSCTGSTFTVTVTVNPTPAITAMTAITCSGGTGFTATPADVTNGIVPSGTTYSWPAPVVTGGLTGGDSGTGQPFISGTLLNPTNVNQTATYTVTPAAGSCTGSPFIVTVTVNPTPAITAMTAVTCAGTGFTSIPVNGTNGIVPSATTYSWSAPAVTGGLTGGTPGSGQSAITGILENPTNVSQTATYTVTPLSGSCTGSEFTVTVTVNPTPAITAMTAITCGGTGFTATPANVINGIVPSGTTYSWPAPAVTGGLTGGTPGSGLSDISGTLANPTNIDQTATYTVTPVSGNCTGSAFTVTVTVNPTPAINAMTATVCTGVGFTSTPLNGTDGIVPAGTTYSWSAPQVSGGLTGGAAGNGQPDISGTLDNPTNEAQTATYTVTPVSGSCTGSTFTVTVTVYPTPAITAMTTSTCGGTGFNVSPANVTDGIVPAGTTYSWPAPAVTGGLTGGAADNGQPTVFGTLANPTNETQTATYTVTPVSGSCTGTAFTVTVTVLPTPAVTAMTATTCGGTGFVTTPVNITNGIVPVGTTYSWSAPDVTGGLTGGISGSDQPDISGTLVNPTNTDQTATYTVTPVSGNCTGAAFTVTVTVNPTPAINAMTASVCSGIGFTSVPVNVTDGIVPAGTTYSWSAPAVTGGLTGGTAGSGQSEISGTLFNPTNEAQTATYTVTPVSGSCTGGTFTVTVTVYPTPAVTAMTSSTCGGTGFNASPANITNGIVPAGTTYSWPAPAVTGGLTGGAPGSSQTNIFGTLVNPTNTTQTATYTVIPVAGSCTGNSFTVTVSVNPTPEITAMTATICTGTGFSSTPVNGTNGIVPSGTTYSWPAPVVTGGLTGGATGSGQTHIFGTLVNPTNTAQTATYTVTPVSGTCTGSAFTVIVTVNPAPAITPMTAAVCTGTGFSSTPVNGTNGIVPSGTTYSWPAPTVTGGMTGGAPGSGQSTIFGTLVNTANTPHTATYTVTPIAGSCQGNSFTVVVTVNPIPVITAMTATTCSGTGFSVTPANGTNGLVPSGTTYSWPAPVVTGGMTGGVAGSGQSTISGTLVNASGSNQTATYTVTPLSGSCTGNTFTVTVTVVPLAVVRLPISSSAYAMMPGTQVTLTAGTPVNGGTAPTYQWRLNGTNLSGETNTTYTYTPSNLDKVSCTLTSNSTAACLSNNPANSNTVAMIVYVAGTPCSGVPTVSHGGKTYNTVQIGTQCWLRENMSVGSQISYTTAQTNNSIVEKYCYNDSLINCDIYGGLYQWNEMMQYVTTPGTQGICPTGWHVPTDAEFATLITTLGGSAVSGGKIKEVGFNHWKSPNTAAVNEYGFTALPSGYTSVGPFSFGSLNRYGYFYTSTQVSSYAYYFTVGYSGANQDKLQNFKTTGNSVRCLKN